VAFDVGGIQKQTLAAKRQFDLSKMRLKDALLWEAAIVLNDGIPSRDRTITGSPLALLEFTNTPQNRCPE